MIVMSSVEVARRFLCETCWIEINRVKCKKLYVCCVYRPPDYIEVNPGPGFINPANTIHASFSQGNVDVFGQNEGRQCVPMSLCFLI